MRQLPCALTLALLLLSSGAVRASPAQDYMLYCRGCHGPEAQGVPGKIPALAHSLALFLRTPAGRDYVMRVPGAANSVLGDRELAGVLNWLLTRFNAQELPPGTPPFTEQEVAQARHRPLAGVQAARRAIVRELASSGAQAPVAY